MFFFLPFLPPSLFSLTYTHFFLSISNPLFSPSFHITSSFFLLLRSYVPCSLVSPVPLSLHFFLPFLHFSFPLSLSTFSLFPFFSFGFAQSFLILISSISTSKLPVSTLSSATYFAVPQSFY